MTTSERPTRLRERGSGRSSALTVGRDHRHDLGDPTKIRDRSAVADMVDNVESVAAEEIRKRHLFLGKSGALFRY